MMTKITQKEDFTKNLIYETRKKGFSDERL
jgi:hypothetical protein